MINLRPKTHLNVLLVLLLAAAAALTYWSVGHRPSTVAIPILQKPAFVPPWPQTARPSAPKPLPRVPDTIAPVLGLNGEGYSERMRVLKSFGKNLSREECAGLYDFLQSPTPEERLGLLAPVKDRVMQVLRDQPNLPGPWHRLLAEIYRDPRQHPTLRDYAVQHLFTLYGYWNERTNIDPAWKTEAREVFWSAVQETDTSIAGTALLGLSELAMIDPDFVRADIASKALEVAQAESNGELSRLTALQVCARMGVAEVLPLARELVARGESIPLRLSAIAVLGRLGDASDAAWLGQLPDRKEPRLQPAVTAAMRQLTRSNPG